MKRPLDRVTMKHLMIVSCGTLLLGLLWIAVTWFAAPDKIWIVPGMFLVVAGIVQVTATQIWIRAAKLGTDEHKPIKAL